jgi:hypothetical protein
VRRLLVTANLIPSSPILVTLMTEALFFSETSVLTRATQLNIQEYGILHSRRRENLKSYRPLNLFPLNSPMGEFSYDTEFIFTPIILQNFVK